jgi:hypothetical protein
MGVHDDGEIGYFGRGGGPPSGTTGEPGTGRGRDVKGRPADPVRGLSAAGDGEIADP